MKYSLVLAASAALVLASPQEPAADAAKKCPTQCGPDEQIETKCNKESSCMCKDGFFAAWTTCRQCLFGPDFANSDAYKLNIEAVNSASARICVPSATESFQPVFSEIANRLGVFDLGGNGGPAAVVATPSAGAPGAPGASAAARTGVAASASVSIDGAAGGSAGAKSDGAAPGGAGGAGSGSGAPGGAGGAARAGAGGAAATSTRAGAGSASPTNGTNGASGARGGNSTSPVSPNAGNSAKVVSGLAVAAVGAAVMLAL